MSGKCEAIINLKGSFGIPSKLASYYDYIAASIPIGFNMTIKLHAASIAEFIADKGGTSYLLALQEKVR